MNIKEGLTKEDLKNILGSNNMKVEFLEQMKYHWKIPMRINRKKQMVIDLKKIGDINHYIIENWDYVVCRDVLRDMFRLTEKYNRGRTAKELFNHF